MKLPGIEPVLHWDNPLVALPVAVPPPKSSPGGGQLEVFHRIVPRGLQRLQLARPARHVIPQDVLEAYARCGRPTPLVRARRLERHLDTPARIYLKREDVLPSGSFKLNTALAQVAQALEEGFGGVVSETGAGQWGLSLAMASAMHGLSCRVFQARCSYEQKPLRHGLMSLHGAAVVPSPSDLTVSGRAMAENQKLCIGSIGTAISEAVEFARDNTEYAYTAGSNLVYVYAHQTVMGLETIRQLQALSERPHVVVACVGGGSNFAGFALPMAYGSEAFAERPRLLACESSVVPRLSRGRYEYDHGDPMRLTPLTKSYTLGSDFVPPPTHVGGLRQHNGSPLIGALHAAGLIEVSAWDEAEVFAAGRLLARLEGVVAAPESCHALCGVIAEARAAAKLGEERVIVSCVSGSGALDWNGYQKHARAS
jgi:tryptophan synthase beta chain